MSWGLPAFAFASAVLSALALYAGSAHCHWLALRRWRAIGSGVGLGLAVLSLTAWIVDLGVGAGVCVMLGTWMLALMGFPLLAAWTGGASDTRANR